MMQRVVVVITLIAVVSVMAPMMAKLGYAANPYSLRVKNDSTQFENFAVFQNDPDLGLTGAEAHGVTASHQPGQETLLGRTAILGAEYPSNSSNRDAVRSNVGSRCRCNVRLSRWSNCRRSPAHFAPVRTGSTS
jgi:hypothetical protein